MSTCSKHYIGMRSLTWLGVTTMQLLDRKESQLRGALNGLHPTRLAYPLPITLEEDAWNAQAALRPGAFPEDETTEAHATIILEETCLNKFKKQKLDDDDDVIDFMPSGPLQPLDDDKDNINPRR